MNKISQRSEVVRTVDEQVKVFNEEDHLEGNNDTIHRLYKELKESILSISADIHIKPKAKYIAFVHKTNFVYIVVRKSDLTLYLNMGKGKLNDPQSVARDVSNVGHWGNAGYEVKVKESTDMGYIIFLIRQSYENN